MLKRLMFWKRRKGIRAAKDPGVHGHPIQFQDMTSMAPRTLMPRRSYPPTFTTESLQRIFTPSFLDELLSIAPDWTLNELIGQLNSFYEEGCLEAWRSRLVPSIYEKISSRILNRRIEFDPEDLMFDLSMYSVLSRAISEQGGSLDEPPGDRDPSLPTPEEEKVWGSLEMTTLDSYGAPVPTSIETQWIKFAGWGRLKTSLRHALEVLPLEPGRERWFRIGIKEDTDRLVYSQFTKFEVAGRKAGVYDYGPGVYFTNSLEYVEHWAKKFIEPDGTLKYPLAVLIMDVKMADMDPDQVLVLPHQPSGRWHQITRDSLRDYGRHPTMGCVVGPLVANPCQVARAGASSEVLMINRRAPLQMAIICRRLAEKLFLTSKLACYIIERSMG